jgi:hypothetical protein
LGNALLAGEPKAVSGMLGRVGELPTPTQERVLAAVEVDTAYPSAHGIHDLGSICGTLCLDPAMRIGNPDQTLSYT